MEASKGMCRYARVLNVPLCMIATQRFRIQEMELPSAVVLALNPDIGDLPRLTAYIEDFGEANGLSMGDVMAFTLAAEELFANTLHHSATPATEIAFEMASGDAMVTAVYSDDASAFDPTTLAAPDTTLGVDDRRIGGLGIHLIREKMSVFQYERMAGRNVVTFGKSLGSTAPR